MAPQNNKPKIKIKPQPLASREAMESRLGDLASWMIERDGEIAEMEKEITKIRDEYAEWINRLNTDVEQAFADVQAWAEANPAEFGKKKSIETVHGTLGFRTGQPQLKLLVKKLGWQNVLDRIKSFKLEKLYIRSSEEVNKEALLNDRDAQSLVATGKVITIADLGVKAVQEETFYVDIKREAVAEPDGSRPGAETAKSEAA